MTRWLVIALLIFSWAADAKTARHKAPLVEFQKLHPCPSTGRKTGSCPGYIKDHIRPLCAGGADSVDNLQWQSKADAAAKDKLEWAECRALKGATPKN